MQKPRAVFIGRALPLLKAIFAYRTKYSDVWQVKYRRKDTQNYSEEEIQNLACRFEVFRYTEFTAIGLRTGSGQIRIVELRQYNIAMIAA